MANKSDGPIANDPIENPQIQLNADDVWNAADGMFASVTLVHDYIEKRMDPSIVMLIGDRTPKENYVLGLSYLVKGWMQTLKKLNEPKDIQAIMTCTRSMVEITVDLIHLHKDETAETLTRMVEFDRWQKYRSARAVVTFYGRFDPPQAVPDKYQELEDYFRKNQAGAERARRELWPNINNPQRWSGKNLLDDVKTADKLLGHHIEQETGSSLEEFYETEYRKLHWYVHGSGLSGYWNISADALSLMCAMGFWWSCDLAMLCFQVILTEFKITKADEELHNEWARHRAARGIAFLERAPKFHSPGTAQALDAARAEFAGPAFVEAKPIEDDRDR
jgi:hypothetical protein